MNAIGTHKRLNEGLDYLANAITDIDGLGIIIGDRDQSKGAIVSAWNKSDDEQVQKFRRNYFRVSFTAKQSSGVACLYDNGRENSQSQHFKNHHLTHIPIGNNGVLQIVTCIGSSASGMDIRTKMELSGLGKSLADIIGYAHNQEIATADMFGLRACDGEQALFIADLSRTHITDLDTRRTLNETFWSVADDVSSQYGLFVYATIGDEIRIKTPIRTFDFQPFFDELSSVFLEKSTVIAQDVHMRAASGVGIIHQEMPVCGYNDVRTRFDYSGDVFEKVSKTVKEMPRDRSVYKPLTF